MSDQATPGQLSGSERELLALLTLNGVPGVGPRTCTALLDWFGDAVSVLKAGAAALQSVEGVGFKLAREIASAPPLENARALLARCAEHGIELLPVSASGYPPSLRRIHDPPMVLYRQGELLPTDELAIAIVGARHASPYGIGVAETLARGLANAGFVIVSGLARGIDAAAHRAAMKAGGRTIAVLGGGLLNVYPPEHAGLAAEIRLQGCLLSEAAPDHMPRGSSFPQRNRIITGLSLGVIVVEAAERSGALISAGLATEQGKEVFAVPGRIDSRLSVGCHRLIRDGAKLVECVDDVLEELGPLAVPVATAGGEKLHHPAELKLNDQERAVLNAIDGEPTDVDAIVARSGLPVPRVLSTLSVLEIRKLVRRLSGSQFSRR